MQLLSTKLNLQTSILGDRTVERRSMSPATAKIDSARSVTQFSQQSVEKIDRALNVIGDRL